ncbi:MAG: hypothetical protein M1836_001846 [Candelina mexicana]|nr:MAG: hypothetical protein M1836_001846 [Candelina mexicana]
MSGIKDVMKSGWHPERKGSSQQPSSSSTLGRLKARGTGLVGRGSSPTEQALNHQSTPLSSLRDPSAFAPPPKRTDYQSSPPVLHAVSSTQAQKQREETGAESSTAGSVTDRQNITSQVPLKAGRTELSTSRLPTPPSMRIGDEPGTSGRRVPAPPPSRGTKPSLPPRLPPRQNSNPGRYTPLPPPPYNAAAESAPVKDDYLTAELTRKLNQAPARHDGQLNQESTNRLARAGVSVPGLEIGGNSVFANPWSEERSSTAQSPASNPAVARAPPLGGLQNKFSKMSASSPKPDSSSQGTSLAQKQAALRTVTTFRDDPSSVSLADAKSAASTANNFRERHGDQVTSGLQTANGMNQKYGISNKINSHGTGSPTSPALESPGATLSSQPMASPPVPGQSEHAARKKPPPAPPKRIGLRDSSEALPPPPPLPLGSKPQS